MTLLLHTHPSDVRELLPTGRSRPGWHSALTQALAHHLSPAHAAILARPEQTADGIAWHADGDRALPLAALGLPERRALLAAAGSILSDIRRLAESGRAPIVATCWPALREIPDLGGLFALDGRPVLAGWGMIPADAAIPPGFLAPHDDGLGWALPPAPSPLLPRLPWRSLAALGLLGLVLGLVAIAAQRSFPPQVCTLGTNQRALLAEMQQATQQHAALEGRLLGLRAAVAAGQKRCLAAAAAPPQNLGAGSPPQPVPVPAPSPQNTLPLQQWQQHDLGMLEGCWHRYTNMMTFDINTRTTLRVKSWKICFNGTGDGTQTLLWNDGVQCSGPVAAHFNPDGTLTISDVRGCASDPEEHRFLYPGRLVCTRTSDTEASCLRTETAGPGAGHVIPGMFRR
ncbi:MAG TPA: hypothetical protein VMU81_09540 [Acetobacteraceae bacterium]|nr:hypothetical protein [Acetobacteraceae bacterium]